MAKIIASLLFGLAVAIICVLSIWRNSGADYYNNNIPRSPGWSTIRSLAQSIESYFIDYKSYPPSITTLPDYPEIPLDPWFNPLDYQVYYSEDGKSSYTLTSYGRDGKPGGRNMYEADTVYPWQPPQDISSIHSDERPSFQQFINIRYTHKPLWACLAAGVVAFLLSLRILPRDFQWQWAAVQRAGGYLVIVLVAAFFVTNILGLIHIPKGH